MNSPPKVTLHNDLLKQAYKKAAAQRRKAAATVILANL
jgi:hypothetical protein